MLKNVLAATAIFAMGLVGGSLYAQQPGAVAPPSGGIKRTPLQKVEVPGSNYEVVFGIAEIPAGAGVPRHSHPGPVLAYVVEGEFRITFDGQAQKVFKAGESFQVPANAVHIEGAGDSATKLMGVYVVEKGKPLAVPAP